MEMTITTISDAFNEGGLPDYEAMLAAYQAGDAAELGKVAYRMIESYIEEQDEDEGYCTNCSGSGEGMHDGTRCSVCHGSGVEPSQSSIDDADEYYADMKRDEEYFKEMEK